MEDEAETIVNGEAKIDYDPYAVLVDYSGYLEETKHVVIDECEHET